MLFGSMYPQFLIHIHMEKTCDLHKGFSSLPIGSGQLNYIHNFTSHLHKINFNILILPTKQFVSFIVPNQNIFSMRCDNYIPRISLQNLYFIHSFLHW
jgi:hypothetical protein